MFIKMSLITTLTCWRQSLTHKEDEGVTPENQEEIYDKNIVSNKPDDYLGNSMNDEDHIHKIVKVHIVVALVDFVNNNVDKNYANKNKSKAYNKKVSLNPKKNATKKMYTPTKAKKTTKKKYSFVKKMEGLEANEKYTGKNKRNP